MAASLFSGGAVGAVIQEVLHDALKIIDKGRDFKPTLERNKDTLDALTPLVEEIKQYSMELDRPREEVERLENEMKAGKELVNKCSEFRWWRFLSFPQYRDKLRKRDKKLGRVLSQDMQVQMVRDSLETLSKVREILEILTKEYVVLGNHGKETLLKGLSGAPENPEFTVGLDEPLKKLKIELLKDGGVSVLMLTGLAGSGKSTLAKKLCWDDQVKGKFGGNVFFVAVSKTPHLKTIVQTLFEHCGRRLPEFQSDEDATNRLGLLLRQVGFGGSPILLVLDDVWPGSEVLVEKFKFQISNYKILVTSRVAFPRFGNPCNLKPLNHDDAVSLFRHFAQLKLTGPYMLDEKLVQEIVRGCKGSPLALEVIGGSLCNQPLEKWQIMKERLKSQSILKSNNDLLNRLQNCLDILEDESSIKEKECFMDLGLFPEDQRIRVPALIDMWAELHERDEDGKKAMDIIHNLTNKNLVNVIVRRKIATDRDLYYNNHFLTQHDLLRELAILQSSKEPFEQRERLMMDLSGNNHPEWWVGQNEQSIISRVLSSFFPLRWMGQKPQQVVARTLSISTDETFTSDWCNIQPDQAEVLVLNIQSSKYTLPGFTDRMSKLKVLIVTNYGFHPSELNKFELLGCLSDLKRIRLEKVSVPCLCKLKSLQKLSLRMCNTKHAFESSSIQISAALPNLVEMNIDYCNDLVELPAEVCKITTLKKLSITNCHKLSALPQEIGELENLELLRLSSCSDLLEIPESVGRLQKLCCLDISDCVNLAQLPEDIGELHSLEKLYMWGCSRMSKLPYSVMNFGDLKHQIYVICDEEVAALWDHFSKLPNLKIELSKADISLNWLPGVQS
ncbi:probable disease resistance protein At5g66900 [Gastrolobium bilobum]|uniref:probable disease resistance protein At5g66900 n=1 Tax=Gastrolobium bilobum TaxID=150636 RepID=UPI002AB06868|nr:probable disease resistance protein At5g66900 [Gastrolobium bilobum]